MNLEYIKLFFSITTFVSGAFLAYHKYIIKEIDKKLDKRIYEKDLEFHKQQRYDDNKTLFNKMDSLEETVRELSKNILEIFKKDKF